MKASMKASATAPRAKAIGMPDSIGPLAAGRTAPKVGLGADLNRRTAR
jgi:hypothetical protein